MSVAPRDMPTVERDQHRPADAERLRLYREIFAHSQDAIGIIAPDGRYIEQNAAHRALIGYSDEELRTHTPAVHLGQERFETIARELAAHGHWRGEVVSRTKLGRPVPVDLSAFAVRDARGEPICYVGIKRDITDQKRAENSLKFLARASELLGASLDCETTLASLARLTVPELADWCAVDIVGERGEIQRLAVAHIDPAKVELARDLHQKYPLRMDAPYGLPAVLRTGQSQFVSEIPDALLVNAARDEQHLRILRELGLKSYMCVPLTVRGRTVGGLTFVSAESGRRYTAHDVAFGEELARRAAVAVDNARLYLAAQEEIAERRSAEAALRTSEERLRALFSQVAVGIAQTDLRGRFVLVNERYCEILGRPKQELLQMRMQDVTHPADLAGSLELFTRLAAGGTDFIVEKRYVRPDGSVVWVNNSVSAICGPEGRPQYVVAVSQDITDRKQAEAALQQANEDLRQKNQEMEQFVYTVSHDLKSPLVTIQGFVGMLREDLAAGEFDDVRDSAGRIERAAVRMSGLISDLLQFSRVGRLDLKREDVDLAALLQELAEELAERMQDAGAALDIQTPLPHVVADRSRLREMFENLLTNALKYGCTGPGSKITIGSQRMDGEIRLFVRDTGPGIAPEHHQRIFGLFQRLDSEQEGTGVGLAIVARVMQAHGGRAWVESAPGQGATFWLAFPEGRPDG